MEYIFKSIPYNKNDIVHVLEHGICSFIVEEEYVKELESIARVIVYTNEKINNITIQGKADEEYAVTLADAGEMVVIGCGCEIIPLENIIAQNSSIYLEVRTAKEAQLASGILECGVKGVVFSNAYSDIVSTFSTKKGETYTLEEARILAVEHVHMGDRVCVDTISLLEQGEGMLLGSSSAFLFLVQAEVEHNEYVASRPFRINAGSVHSYAVLPKDRTCYLSELSSGREILICNNKGETRTVVVGRIKIEQRPMLMITAQTPTMQGTIFVQNAETITLICSGGMTKSVTKIAVGDNVLVHTDKAGRHFGMRVEENIQE